VHQGRRYAEQASWTMPANCRGSLHDARAAAPQDDHLRHSDGGIDMTTSSSLLERDGYVLGRNAQEHQRLRAQARAWNGATGRLLDVIRLAPGARCLDAGCGPGETMRLMAERVGPAGEVLGVDVDATLGSTTREVLRGEGFGQCEVLVHDVTDDLPLPGAPFDLVYARLLLFHLPQRVSVLRRLWGAVAPGGYLLVQDYDLRGVSVLPELPTMDEVLALLVAGMTAAGCDVTAGARLPQLFAEAGVGEPDGTDVAGRIEPVRNAAAYLEATFRSVLPAALARRVTTESEAHDALEALARDVRDDMYRQVVLPLLIGAWKRRPPDPRD
jgi:ubiquinone/menaquinone biosynthesis C-methylase UbiE